ncbi:aminomethyltransferase family protein [Aestuariispira insulae]|uniref:Aminomethyltransferase n=1 Tax=Aestuariispira insulae TaxID=1461337 RepID=A0A3D9H661_9PROT|nr:aminomethyltransferase family protein [Aestuariispira insulae]RED44651.1 aminomethyltransferase [Aestuariispira insulae]
MTAMQPKPFDSRKLGMRQTPFYPRQMDWTITNDWLLWAGYTSPGSLDVVEQEYFAIRNSATVFDITPMCKYRVSGPEAELFLNRLVTRDIRKMRDNRVSYVIWCDDEGHMLDDGTVFKYSNTEYRLCCQERQYDWLTDNAIGLNVEIQDVTDDIAALAFQGPTTCRILKNLGLAGVEEMKPFDIREFPFGKGTLSVSRTGFTGDLGYELWIDPEQALDLWDTLFEAGRHYDIRPIGSHALDLARMEAGLLQPNVDFQSAEFTLRHSRRRSPFEIGMEWQVDFTKGHFNGRRALLKEKQQGTSKYCLVGLDIEGNKPAHAALIYHRQKKEIGRITSAMWSPTLKTNIALAELKRPFGIDQKEDIWVEIYVDKEMKWERVMARARIVSTPFFAPARKNQTPPADY